MTWDPRLGSLDFTTLRDAYRAGSMTPEDVVHAVHARITARGDDCVWIDLVPEAETAARARDLGGEESRRPLYGLPFAIKDNIDLGGRPTTAGCPAFSQTPAGSAPVVARLIAAGALPIGKTNLDQFASGLSGVVSPYGAPSSVFDRDYISGGSSSGSAVAVAAGLVSFALGTDTAGSGRVPAAFNNIVGLKPTRGLLSTLGVVPACRTLDCVSIFALACDDAWDAMAIAQGFEPGDPFSRRAEPSLRREIASPPLSFRFGVPEERYLVFHGDRGAERLYREALDRLEILGGTRVVIDYTPFAETAKLLYGGPWVAERYAAIASFFDAHPEALQPMTRKVIGEAQQLSAAAAFQAQYRLAELRDASAATWTAVDVLALPTAPTIFRREEAIADPRRCHATLGTYTNFVNLLDLAAIAVPAGFDERGLPFGITLMAPAFSDADLCSLGDIFQRASVARMGATPSALPPPKTRTSLPRGTAIAVVGAHLQGMPLNHQLTDLGATLVRATHTAPSYRLYALAATTPPKPGLERVAAGGGRIEVEVWDVPTANVGAFLAGIAAPLALGRIELEDGEWVTGFVCEPWGFAGATDITGFGGWRAYRASCG